jgi:hypothetical protein
MITVGRFLMQFLTAAFLLGLAGSAIVVAISFFEDFRELLSRD